MTAFFSMPLFMSELRDVLSQPYRVKKEETPASPYCFEGKKVLLVEDNLLNQEIAQAILQDAGFTVDTADDGDVAVERLQDSKQGEFDLVLMDIQMPKMDGYAATRQNCPCAASLSPQRTKSACAKTGNVRRTPALTPKGTMTASKTHYGMLWTSRL